MGDYAKIDLQNALKAIVSMIQRSEKAQQKFAPGTSQHTLQKNRIHALTVAKALIEQELSGSRVADFSKADLEQAVAPLASLISKTEKAWKKLKEGSWQHAMLEKNLQALYIASPLLSKMLSESQFEEH